jgi:hypothetical protein
MRGGRHNFKNLVNMKFGRLLVVEESNMRGGKGEMIWICLCDCGNTHNAVGNELVRGNTKSCGCLFRELKTKDISDQRFGKLTALYATGERKRGSYIWLCECECGVFVEIPSAYLCSGDTKSCGCLRDKHQQGVSYTKIYAQIKNHERRARVLNATVTKITPVQLEQIYKNWNNRCAYCGGQATTLDHIVPLIRGGEHSLENLIPACRHCNSSKNAKQLSKWISEVDRCL